jgi:hypothetical protein
MSSISPSTPPRTAGASWPSWLLLIAALVGCGEREDWAPVIRDPAFPVRGKVIMPGGKPLTSGRIEFIPVKEPGLMAYATIAPDGTFQLRTREPGDGAIPGTYKVRIMPPEKVAYRNLARYRDEDSSRLTVTIKAESNELSPFALR